MKWVIAIGGVTVAIFALWWWTKLSSRINHWDLVNAPPKTGRVLCLGDSLVAGVGADTPAERFSAHLGRALSRRVVAVGTPGQTTKEALDAIRERPELTAAVVIVTLGGNDILKQIPWPQTEANLGAIFQELQKRGAVVVLTAVEGPISGSRSKGYRALCRKQGVLLVPDILDGILGNQDLMSDAVHPNGEGYRLMAERVLDILKPRLSSEGDNSDGTN